MRIISTILILLLISIGLLIGGYTGKIPVVAEVLGFNTSKDLGIDYSKIDVDNVHKTLGTSIIENSEKAKGLGVLMEGSKKVKYTLTQEEISALSNKSPYKYNPFKNAQVKINDDGSVEASAILKVEMLFGLAKSMGYSADLVKEQMDKYSIPVKDLPVYAKATGSVENNKIKLGIEKAEVAKIPLPTIIIDEATPQIVRATEGIIQTLTGFDIKSLTFKEGKMNFEGSIPEKQHFE